jgi:hypothetical protein
MTFTVSMALNAIAGMFGKGKKMKNDQMALRWIHWVENHLLP